MITNVLGMNQPPPSYHQPGYSGGAGAQFEHSAQQPQDIGVPNTAGWTDSNQVRQQSQNQFFAVQGVPQQQNLEQPMFGKSTESSLVFLSHQDCCNFRQPTRAATSPSFPTTGNSAELLGSRGSRTEGTDCSRLSSVSLNI